MVSEEKVRTKIKVTVTFPGFSRKPPFQDEFQPSATLLEIRQAAMRYFEVSEDPTSVYYLTYHRQRQSDDVLLGDLVGHARAAEFRLAKETIQG